MTAATLARPFTFTGPPLTTVDGTPLPLKFGANMSAGCRYLSASIIGPDGTPGGRVKQVTFDCLWVECKETAPGNGEPRWTFTRRPDPAKGRYGYRGPLPDATAALLRAALVKAMQQAGGFNVVWAATVPPPGYSPRAELEARIEAAWYGEQAATRALVAAYHGEVVYRPRRVIPGARPDQWEVPHRQDRGRATVVTRHYDVVLGGETVGYMDGDGWILPLAEIDYREARV